MNKSQPRILRIIASFLIPLYTLIPTPSSYAEIPDSAEVTQIIGPNSLGIRRRRGGDYDPVSQGTIMKILDKLDIPSSGRTYAKLEFYNKSNLPMGLAVQASIKNNLRTSYYFPCLVETKDTFIIEWTNPKTTKRGCANGFKVRSGSRRNTNLPDSNQFFTFASIKQWLMGQKSPSSWRYCTVVDERGRGWLGISQFRSNPCEKPLQECEATGKGNCVRLTFDYWETEDSELTASVSCANNQEFILKESGLAMKERVEQIWQEAKAKGATFCGLQVFSHEDTIIEPSWIEEINRVEIGNIDPCLTFRINEGEVRVRSVKKPEGVSIKKGDQYQYCLDQQVDSNYQFDASVESIDMQIFLARSRGYEFCDRQQASGGQEGDVRRIQLTANQGEIRLDYEMYGIPDRLRVIYENRELVNTGFVSGRKSLSIPFSGNSGQVTVELTGNIEKSETKWNYTLYCPQ